MIIIDLDLSKKLNDKLTNTIYYQLKVIQTFHKFAELGNLTVGPLQNNLFNLKSQLKNALL